MDKAKKQQLVELLDSLDSKEQQELVVLLFPSNQISLRLPGELHFVLGVRARLSNMPLAALCKELIEAGLKTATGYTVKELYQLTLEYERRDGMRRAMKVGGKK